MALKIVELVSITLSALVMGVFWGPWLGIHRSSHTFGTDLYLEIGRRMGQNIGPVMTVLMPVSLLSMLPVLVLSYGVQPQTFYLTLVGVALFVTALLVTMIVEVPIANQIAVWTPATLPSDWQRLRDRWGRFHVVRVIVSVAGLMLLVSGAIF